MVVYAGTEKREGSERGMGVVTLVWSLLRPCDVSAAVITLAAVGAFFDANVALRNHAAHLVLLVVLIASLPSGSGAHAAAFTV